jgi:hypothetical protein
MTTNHRPSYWHIVNRLTGQHIGPFSTELDCALARSIAGPGWANGIDMNRKAFNKHLKQQQT